jgi:hypothetical protein
MMRAREREFVLGFSLRWRIVFLFPLVGCLCLLRVLGLVGIVFAFLDG